MCRSDQTAVVFVSINTDAKKKTLFGGSSLMLCFCVSCSQFELLLHRDFTEKNYISLRSIQRVLKEEKINRGVENVIKFFWKFETNLIFCVSLNQVRARVSSGKKGFFYSSNVFASTVCKLCARSRFHEIITNTHSSDSDL